MADPHISTNDPALLELFRAELDTHIPVLSDGLLALEKGGADEQTVAGMMRAAHSIKGAARIVGIEEAVRVAHALEDCFTAAKDHRIVLTSAAVDVLLQVVDVLQRICSPQPDATHEPAMLDRLLKQIAAVRDGQLSTPAVGQVALSDGPSFFAESRTADERFIMLPANLNDGAAEHLRVQLCEAIRDHARSICLDFTHVDRVSAQALSILISLVRESAGSPALAACGIGDELARLMRVSGLDRAWSAGAGAVGTSG